MADSTRMVRKYARAIFLAANKANELRITRKRLLIIGQIYKSVPEFRLLLQSRRIDLPMKMTILRNVLKDIATPIELELFQILLENKDTGLFSQVMTRFFIMSEKESDTVKVTISTAEQINEKSVSDIISAVSASAGKQIEPYTRTDPGLIGGMTLRIGNKIVDGSVVKRLEKLKTSLMKA